MRTFTKVLGVTAVAALVLTGCGRNSDTGATPGASNGGSAAAGFPANAMIGVALPKKTWALASSGDPANSSMLYGPFGFFFAMPSSRAWPCSSPTLKLS